MNSLKGKIAIITGGTKGLGLAMTKKLSKEGAIVFACSRHPINLKLKNVFAIPIDVTDFINCQKLAKAIFDKKGKIDILVNNAGVMKDKLTEKMSVDDFNFVVDTNLKGTFNMTKAVIPFMLKNQYGSIINISSLVAQQGNFGQANYVASKAGIEGMTKCWAREFARHGENIRVNAIAPGPVLTDIFNNTPSEAIKNFINKSMLKKMATPEDIANIVWFLASDLSSCITGTTITADCGCRF